MEQYSVRLESFEGPMELLMHLIEKNKIDIYDIPIAELTEQYIEYLDQFREFNLDIASEFLVMAATLLQIKSRMMLPKPVKVSEDQDVEDPRQELIQRILEYRRYKEVSNVLEDMQAKQERYFTRQPMELPVHHLPPDNLSMKDLLHAFNNVLAMHRELKIPDALVEPEEYTVSEKMELILSLLNSNGGKVKFEEAFSCGNRSELITTFLAVLELIKLKTIKVWQQDRFSDIYISIRVGEN
ncbi:MAG: segregation/condensation protein A [Anaerovibrio sp.]|uniref:segregation and condensation protein A n=1 Tax=Anaerovibrio sp. TaxID=1872532 RepID=UPI0025FE4F85|nr:segregation/condensation protein A [Anaerovibrio sp.]MCR5175835.1 segregation/condensation protein A [Anaerovibrio sp.]